MGLQKHLVLRRSEWDRIKRQRETFTEPVKDDVHIKRMDELSQKWIRSWPDTVSGHIELHNKKESNTRKKVIEEIKRLTLKKKKDDSAEAIQKAKQLIFEDSCHGKQLVSCLIESKTLEERNAQVEFQNKIKNRAAADEEAMLLKLKQQILDLENAETAKIKERKKKHRVIAEINKATYQMQNEERLRYKESQKQREIEETLMIKNLLEDEKQHIAKGIDDAVRYVHQENIEYIKLRKQLQENRAKEQTKNDRIDEVWRKYNERIRHKERFILEETTRRNSLKKLDLYKKLEEIQKIEKSKYGEFIEKGIKHLEKKLWNEENENMKKHTQQTENFKSGLIKHDTGKETVNKSQTDRKLYQNFPLSCHCDRQTLFCKSSKQGENKNVINSGKEQQCVQFLTPPRSLVKDLKRRQREPPPWSGTRAAHEQFAQQASNILRECRFKKMALKVVDKYRRAHGLNADNLPISNI